MKKLFIILLSFISITIFAFESNQMQFPQIEFKSTSSYQSGINYNPNITKVGATTIYDSPQSVQYNKQYKVVEHPGDPFATPAGDISFISMLLFAGAYTFCKKNKSW